MSESKPREGGFCGDAVGQKGSKAAATTLLIEVASTGPEPEGFDAGAAAGGPEPLLSMAARA